MNLIDKKVTHKVFGEGNIVNHSGASIEVSFAVENKKFLYPDAFAKFLILHDTEEAKAVAQILQVQEAELKEVEQQKELERVRQVEKQKMLVEYERLMHNHKLHGESQMVYWCDAEEASAAFENWSIFTGVTKSGANKGKPSVAVRLYQNSAVLLTERLEGCSEQTRKILGVYMVKEGYIGKLSTDGFVPAHSVYKIQLTEEEAEQLLFWQYYCYKNAPEKLSWNTGKYRYFDNEWMAQILKDIIALKQDETEKEHAQKFLNYFCKMNKISVNEIALPKGILVSES